MKPRITTAAKVLRATFYAGGVIATAAGLATVRALAGALFLAGLARAWAWQSVGEPHRAQQGLVVAELIGPPVIAAWQARVASSA